MEGFLQDLRHGVRILTRAPLFAGTAVLTLAIGVGANATVFSFVDALLFRPAPGVTDAGTLVAIYTSDFSSGPYGSSSYPDFESLRVETSGFSGMAAEQDDGVTVVRVGNAAERVRVSSVTGGYFEVLGIKPHLGRLLTDDDATAGAPPAAVVGHALWRRAFDASPAALGSILDVDGRKHAIVGIVPESFQGLDIGRAFEIWTPLTAPPATPAERGNRRYAIVARLQRSTPLREAQAQVAAVASRLGEMFPATNMGTLGAPDTPRPMIAMRHTRLGPEFRGMVGMVGAILMAAVALVLVIACANVAGLMLSRVLARDREIAVRLALGAGRARLLRQLLSESLLLGLAAGALGLLMSLWTSDALPTFFPPEQARLLDAGVDVTTVAVVLGLSLATGLLLGLAPALGAVRPVPAAALHRRSSGAEGRLAGRRMRRALVAAQIAVAVVLLVSATLLVRSLLNAARTDLGFVTRSAVLASVEVPRSAFDDDRLVGYYRESLERLRRLPGVQDAATARVLPLSRGPRRGFQMEGYVPQAGEDMELFHNVVSEHYFDTLGIPIVAGRAFDSRDTARGAPVAIVNELLANRYYGGRAVGRRLVDSGGVRMEIVGVARSGKHLTVQNPPVPVVYYPLRQRPDVRMAFVVRTAGDPARSIETVRRQLAAVDPDVALFRVVTLSSHIAESLAGDRLTTTLIVACGAVALLLASIGIYGVIAYAVARRTREIGVRIALGARPAHIVRLVLGEGVGMTAVGLLGGLTAAAVAARGLDSLLYGVSAADPMTYVGVPAALAFVALLAAAVPAWRALQLEPHVVMRDE